MNIVERIVRVVFKGVDDVSGATGSAGGAISSFTSKIPGWATAAAALTVGYQAIKAAMGAVRDTIAASFTAFDDLQTSQRKLEGTSKLTGMSLDYLQQVAEKGRREFGLSRVVANDFATEVAKLEKVSGGAASASDLLNGFLNIGAARGLSAAESMDAARQAILGIDEGTDKLFGKNPSGLWADYAKVIGKNVGQFTDMDKQAALAFYTLEGGARTGGAYKQFLESAQGQQAAFNMKLEEAKATLGETLQPLRALALEGLGGLIEYLQGSKDGMDGWVASLVALLKATGEAMKPFVVIFSFTLDSISVALERSMIEIRRWAYGITNVIGQVLRAFGVEFGDVLINQAQSKFFKLNEDHEAFRKRLESIAAKWRGDEKKAEEDQAAEIPKIAQKRATKVVEISEAEKNKLLAISKELEEKVQKLFAESKDNAIDASTKLREVFGTSLTVALGGAGDAIQKIRDRLVEVQQTNAPDEVERLTRRSEGYIETLRLMNDAHKLTQELDYGLPPRDAKERLQGIIEKLEEQAFLEMQSTGNAEDYRKRLDLIRDLKGKLNDLKKEGVKEDEKANKEAEKTEKTTQKMFENVSNIARSALDVFSAFELVDREVGSALTSVINIGDNIAKMMAGGDVFAGVSGILGGVANIVSVMMDGDAERRRATNLNNARLRELNDTIGDLDLNVTGDDLLTAQDVLKKILPLVGSPEDAFKNSNAVREILAKAGMTFGDLARIADEMGINIKGANGSVDLALLPQLLEGLGLIEPGKFGTDFNSQLRAARAGFDVNNVGDLAQIGQIAGIGGRFSQGLRGVFDINDLAGSRQRFQDLFNRFSNGGVSAQELGDLTGNQFLDLVTDIIGRIDGLSAGGGGSGSTGIPPLTLPGGTGNPTGGGAGGVTSGYADLIAALGEQTDTLAVLLTDSLGVQREIAHNTSSGWGVLEEIRGLRADIVGGRLVEGVDAALEARRRTTDLSRGRLPSTV